MRPEILTVPLPLILPTIVMLELIEEISSADVAFQHVRSAALEPAQFAPGLSPNNSLADERRCSHHNADN